MQKVKFICIFTKQPTVS